jgi:hypothetical protein
MHHLLKAIAIVAILGLNVQGQDTYIKGHQWYGHEVDLCYLDFARIREQGDPQGIFAYAKLHLDTMTHFEHGQPVQVLRKQMVEPEEITLVLIRRVDENTLYWTHSAALTNVDPFAKEKSKAEESRAKEAQEKAKQVREKFKVDAKQMQLARAISEDPHRRSPIALHRYWQVGKERFRGKLLNANETHVKVLKGTGDTIILDRRHLSETSNLYVDGMLHDLKVYREYQEMIKASVL